MTPDTRAGASAAHGPAPVRRSADRGSDSFGRSAVHGFDPFGRSAEHGFTLIELMVVIAIIGLAAATVSLAIPDPRGRLSDEAGLFANRLRAAHDAAIVAARPVSLWVSPGGYGFDERAAGRWTPMGDVALRVASWKEGTRALVAGPGGRERVVFDETGLVDRPLDVPLVRGRYTSHVRVAADGGVRISD